MKRKVLSIALVLALMTTLAIPMAAFADISGTVTCTVSAELVSVVVTNGTVDYGVVALSGNQDTTGQVNHPTAQNNGTVAEDFNIYSSSAISNTVGSPQDWALAGTPGDATFTHNFRLVGGTTWTALTGTGQTLVNNIAASDSQAFDLQILMPTATTDYGTHTITVTILATKN
jgi:hypothetical protein